MVRGFFYGDNMKAIDTEYNGYLFRSRLEARWAVFFDWVGIKWIYEPEGFILKDGTRYLPDFYLPEIETDVFCVVKRKGVWVEVKGINSKEADRKCRLFASSKNTIVLLEGQIPTVEGVNSLSGYGYDLYTHYEDGIMVDDSYMFCECDECGKIELQHCGWAYRMNCDCNADMRSKSKANTTTLTLQRAYKKARQARFETY